MSVVFRSVGTGADSQSHSVALWRSTLGDYPALGEAAVARIPRAPG